MFIYSFEDLDNEAADAIHFEKALSIIAKANGRSVKEAATLLSRAMESFQKEHPYNGMEFNLYYYHLTTGFQTNAHITQLSKIFLNEIAKNIDFVESADPACAGTYSFITDSGESGTYYCFYFKISQLLRFFIEYKLNIPEEFSPFLAAAEKAHAFYKNLIKKETDRFFTETYDEDNENRSASPAKTEVAKWSDFAGKDTALMMLAGLIIALEKTGGRYIRGGKLNKSALARAAIDAINEYGEGTEITPKALTNLIDEALSTKIRKLEG